MAKKKSIAKKKLWRCPSCERSFRISANNFPQQCPECEKQENVSESPEVALKQAGWPIALKRILNHPRIQKATRFILFLTVSLGFYYWAVLIWGVNVLGVNYENRKQCVIFAVNSSNNPITMKVGETELTLEGGEEYRHYFRRGRFADYFHLKQAPSKVSVPFTALDDQGNQLFESSLEKNGLYLVNIGDKKVAYERVGYTRDPGISRNPRFNSRPKPVPEYAQGIFFISKIGSQGLPSIFGIDHEPPGTLRGRDYESVHNFFPAD